MASSLTKSGKNKSHTELERIHTYRREVSDAVSKGDVQRVIYIIERTGIDVNFIDPNLPRSSFTSFGPPLLAACQRGKLNVVRALLKNKNVQVDLDHDGSTPLSAAAGNGYIEIMELLLQYGASVNPKRKENHHSILPFIDFARSTVWSPLYCAANNGQHEAALILLRNGADVNCGSSVRLFSSSTPLVVAAKRGDDKMVKLLINNSAKVQRSTSLDASPLGYACVKGNKKCARILIQHGANVDDETFDGTPLVLAAQNGHTQCAKLLLENGADVNKSCKGAYPNVIRTPLTVAAKNGHMPVVQILLTYGVDVNKSAALEVDADIGSRGSVRVAYYNVMSNVEEGNALYYARRFGHHDIAELLRKYEANEDSKHLNSQKRIAENTAKDASDSDGDTKRLAAVELAIKEKGRLDNSFAHGVLVGPARSGKSSLMQRLTGEIPNSTSPSTGVAKQVIQVGVRKVSSIALSVQDSIWFKLLYDDEAIRLMTLASHAVHDQPQQSGASPHTHSSDAFYDTPLDYLQMVGAEDVVLTAGAIQTLQTYTCMLPTGYTTPIEVFKTALQQKSLKGLHQHLENSWSLYLTDTGGQMEFQELLPLLVSGPSIFFITFCLHQDLNQRFTIEYHLPDGGRSKPYQSTLTVKESILQTLASVASMGTFVYKGPEMESAPLKPKVFIIGTHKDKLNPATAQTEIKKIDQHLQMVIKSTSHYQEDLVEFASESQLMFTVNNPSEDESDFRKIRLAVEQIVCCTQFQVSFPSHWLIFSLVLRQEMIKENVISYQQCSEIAKHCGITDLEELDNALWFLHTKIGLIRHFPTSGLRDIVIRHPQILFDMVTKLIVNTFTFEKVRKRCSTEFAMKGIFSLKDFTQVEQGFESSLPPNKLLELLEHLRIVAPFQEKGEDKFFIPCVLSHFEDSQCQSLPQTSDVPPLLVNFECGFCPKGLSGALIVYLLSNEMKSKFNWELLTDQIFRDQVTFCVSPYDNITLKIHLKYLEIVHSCTSESERTQTLEDVCNKVRSYIEKGITKVSRDMNLTSQAEHSLSFYCQNSNCCPEEAHPATKISKDETGSFCNLWCKNSGKILRSPLPAGYSVWFGEKNLQGADIPPTFLQPSISSHDSKEVHHLTKSKKVSATHPDHTTTTQNDVKKTGTTSSSCHLQSEQGAGVPSLTQKPHGIAQPRQDENPVLSQAFRMLLPLASEWQSIGVLLRIPKGDLNTIQSDNPYNTKNCLSDMLGMWLTRIDSQVMWSSLADAVECIDPSKADAIRQQYCN